MIQIPFKRDGFTAEMKPKISGANLSLEYDNIESALMKVSKQVSGIISQKLYKRLVDQYLSGAPSDVEKPAIDYLQRAMLHFAIYEHMIYLTLNISNDGITTKKTDTETTAFKYQTDELNDKLLSDAWFWMNMLITYLEEHLDDFPEWKDSKERLSFLDLPVDLNDFNRWVGVDLGGEFFMLMAAWIIREVWIDCVKSRMAEPKKTDAVARAVCYETMGRACERLAYNCLPSPIRRDIDNEMGKNHRAQIDKDIRERIAGKFLQKASSYWNALDLELKQERIAANQATVYDRPVLGKREITQSDKFFYT